MKKQVFTILSLVIWLSPVKAGWNPFGSGGPCVGFGCKGDSVIAPSWTKDTWEGAGRAADSASSYSFYLHNLCSKYLDVTFEYIPNGSSRWKKENYVFQPGERAKLANTRNRNVYVSAKSRSGDTSWNRKEVNMGVSFVEYTHRLTCR